MDDKEVKFDIACSRDAPYWALKKGLKIDGRPFTLEGRMYQQEIMRPVTDDGKVKQNEVIRKGSQIGVTMGKVIEISHGALYQKYPQGVIYYFPSTKAVEHFSKTRFKPFLDDNPDEVKKYVNDVNAVAVRRIGSVNVNFFGGSATSRVAGEKKDSTAVRSTPADWVLLDERDLFDDEMAEQVNQRLGNSTIKRRTDLGTPTIPEVGVDLLYKKCLVPETKILKADLRWTRADQLRIGDKLIGFDEDKCEGEYLRRYRSTEITAIDTLERPCARLLLEDGNSIDISYDHRMLVQGKDQRFHFRSPAQNLKLGDRLVSIGTWEEGNTKDDGYISGAYDGEGHIYRSTPDKKQRRGRASTIGFTQKEGEVIDKVQSILEEKGFRLRKYFTPRWSRLEIAGGLPEMLRFLGTFRPVRLLKKADVVWKGVSVGHDHGNTKYPKIVQMEYLGYKKVIALTTEHKTFIANGLLSHNSDQRRWQIKCDCGKYTCLETEGLSVISLKPEPHLVCIHCGKEIYTERGQWIPDFPDRPVIGYWASQLLNPNCDLRLVLNQFEDPEAYGVSEAELRRTVLGEPYICAEDQLSESDVYACCGKDSMSYSHKGPCAMGVDVGDRMLHVVIGHRLDNKRYKIVKLARVPIDLDFGPLHDIAMRFGIKSCVIDAMPSTQLGRAFQRSESYAVYLCFYSEHQKMSEEWTTEGLVKVNRTEIFDTTHRLVVSPGRLVLPRIDAEVKEFAHQMTMAAKVLEEDVRTGTKIYRYRKVGDKQDHFRNALNYFYLAASKCGIPQDSTSGPKKLTTQNMEYSLN